VVDADNNPVFAIEVKKGDGNAYLYGPNGKGMIGLSAGPDGSGLVMSSSLKNDNPDVTLFASSEGTALLMNAPKGKKGVELAADANGGDIAAYDAKGVQKK
jgi:hypothetical protein